MNKNLSKGVAAAGLACIFGMNTACTNLPEKWTLHDVPLSRASVNVGIFINQEDFRQQRDLLKVGMSPDEAFATMGFTKEQVDKYFQLLEPKEIMPVVLGGGTLQIRDQVEADKIQKKTENIAIYKIQYKETETRGGISYYGKTQSVTKGFDMNMYLIFEEGRMRAARISSNPVNTKEEKYLWDIGGDALKAGIVGGVAVMGAKTFAR